MTESYEEPSGGNPNIMVTGSLFIICWRISLRRLEGMFVLGKAAAVGENTLLNLF